MNIKIRHTFFCWIALFFSPISHAQLGLEAGFRIGPVHGKTFSQFADTYSGYWSTLLEKPIKGLGMTNGWAAGIDYEISGVYSSLRISKVSAHESAKFISGGQRHFDFSQFLTTFTTGFGMQKEEGSFHVGVGFALGTDRIETYYEYADGTISYGHDKTLNGIYQGMHFSYLADAGFAYTIFDGIMAYAQLDFLFGNFGKTEWELIEWHPDRQLDIFNPGPSGLQTNYAGFDPNAPTDQDVRSDMNGFRFELGVRYQFNL